MKNKYVPFLLATVGLAALGFLKYAGSQPPSPTAETRQPRHLPVRQLKPTDPDVRCSILKDVSLSIEIQPQWTQEREFLLQVNVEKLVGAAYLVNPVEQSYILFVDGHPWAVPESHQANAAAQQTLRPGISSHHPVLRFPPDIPDGAELVIEWINDNLRTNQLERLRSPPLIVKIAG